METLRFLMVTTFYPPYHLGGDAVHVKYLAEALAQRGHEVHVEFAPAAYRIKGGRPTSEAVSRHDGVELHPIPSPWRGAQPLSSYLFGRSRSVTRHHQALVDELKPDVVHLHNISLLSLGRELSALLEPGRPCTLPTTTGCGAREATCSSMAAILATSLRV